MALLCPALGGRSQPRAAGDALGIPCWRLPVGAAGTQPAGLGDDPVSVSAHTASTHGSSHPAAFVLLFREVLGVEALWPILLAANAVPALVQLLTLPFFPDSPRYLLIDRKDKEGCIKGKEMSHKSLISGNGGEHSKAPDESGREVQVGKRLLVFWL